MTELITPLVTAVLGITLALAPAERTPALQSLLDEAREAERRANFDPDQGAAALGDTLAKFEDHAPALATDPEAREARLLAQLTFARALLASGDPEGAREAIDEGIRMARDEKLPVQMFGPELADLHEERTTALAAVGRGAIEVRCTVPCAVYLDEGEAQPQEPDLPLGHYRLWVEPKEAAAAEPLRRAVTLDAPGETVTVLFPVRVPAPTAALAEGEAPLVSKGVDRPAPERARLLPRWTEVTALVIGALAVGGGAVRLAIDGKCTRADRCTDVFRTRDVGIATLAAGGAFMITAGILLTIDEVRIRKRRSRQSATAAGPWLRF